MANVPNWRDDTVVINAAGTVLAYGPDLEVLEYTNISATAIVAGDAVSTDFTTAIPTTGVNTGIKRGNCVAKSAATAGLPIRGIALDPIAASGGRGRVVTHGCVGGTVGALCETALTAGNQLQTIATAGKIGLWTVDDFNVVAVLLEDTSGGSVAGHIRLLCTG